MILQHISRLLLISLGLLFYASILELHIHLESIMGIRGGFYLQKQWILIFYQIKW